MAIKQMTAGDPAKLIFFFTMPLIAGNIVQQLYGFVDTLLVGRFLGVQALASVGCAMALMFLCVSMVIGLTSGMTIYTGQMFGAIRYERVHKSVAACIVMGMIIAIILGGLGYFYCRDILEYMDTPADVIDGAVAFIEVFFATLPLGMMFILGTQLIRALGDSKAPTIIFSITLGINILLEPVYMLWFGWGIPGAAWATVTCQFVGLIMVVYYIWKKIPLLHVRKSDWELNWYFMYMHIRLALPMAFQSSVIALGIFFVQVALNKLGPAAVASFAAAMRVDSIAMMPMMSFGIAMAAYTAQNYGAQDFDRIREGVRKCIYMSVAFSILVGIFNAFCGIWIMEAFVGADAVEVIEYGDIYLLINGSTYWILALLFIYRYTLQGVGQTIVPTIAGIMELIMRAGASIYLADIWGYTGVCFANPLAWLGSCVPLAIAYYATVYKRKNPGAPLVE